MVNMEKRKTQRLSGQSQREMLQFIHHHSERDGSFKNVSVALCNFTEIILPSAKFSCGPL